MSGCNGTDESLAIGRGTGLVFLSATMQMIGCDRAAETLLASDDGLAIQDGVLRAHSAGNDEQLRAAVRQASAARVGLTAPAGIAISRRSAKRPLQVIVAPLRHGLATVAGMKVPHVALTIIDPELRVSAVPGVLIGLYGLTTREAALASVLSSGQSVAQAAARLGITYETARSHLRRVFEKTGTVRQAELVALLARLPCVSVE